MFICAEFGPHQPKGLMKVAPGLFWQAEEYRRRSDEEQSYLHYTKYLDHICQIRKSKELKNEDGYFYHGSITKKIEAASDQVKRLRQSLSYRLLEEQQQKKNVKKVEIDECVGEEPMLTQWTTLYRGF